MSAWLVVALGACLVACGSSSSALREWEDTPHGEAEACGGDDRCVTVVCGLEEEDLCGLYRCEDTGALLARGGGRPPVTASAPGFGPRRNWGGAQALPGERDAILTFRWYNHPAPVRPADKLPSGPGWERHHLYPQETAMKAWFARAPRGINVHDFTMIIPRSEHVRIHNPGGRGGPWNEAWREFARLNPRANQQHVKEQLAKMLVEFNVMGPVVPYTFMR